MSYIRIVSWHSLVLVDELGWHTRCGRLVGAASVVMSDTLPMGEKSCERCLQLTVHDKDRENVSNDEVAG